MRKLNYAGTAFDNFRYPHCARTPMRNIAAWKLFAPFTTKCYPGNRAGASRAMRCPGAGAPYVTESHQGSCRTIDTKWRAVRRRAGGMPFAVFRGPAADMDGMQRQDSSLGALSSTRNVWSRQECERRTAPSWRRGDVATWQGQGGAREVLPPAAGRQVEARNVFAVKSWRSDTPVGHRNKEHITLIPV